MFIRNETCEENINFSAVEGFDNVSATTTYCTTSSCNKVAGKTTGLELAVASSGGASDGDTDNDPAAEGSDAVDLVINLSIFILPRIFL